MKRARLTDFFFIGLAIVPVALAGAGLPDLALLLFVPLLIAACLCGLRENAGDPHKAEAAPPRADGANRAHGSERPATFTQQRRAP